MEGYRASALVAAKRRFREIFPRGFNDPTYLDWERGYKWAAHEAWVKLLDQQTWKRLLVQGRGAEAASRVATFYARSKLNMLALYEWMALREALAHPEGGPALAQGLYDLIHGRGAHGLRLERFADLLDQLPQRQTRLAKWPVATLFPFVACPDDHLILKPRLMKRAAERFGWPLNYESRPNARTYQACLQLADWLREQLSAWKPRDLIDVQGFVWVVASDEYEDWPWE